MIFLIRVSIKEVLPYLNESLNQKNIATTNNKNDIDTLPFVITKCVNIEVFYGKPQVFFLSNIVILHRFIIESLIYDTQGWKKCLLYNTK